MAGDWSSTPQRRSSPPAQSRAPASSSSPNRQHDNQLFAPDGVLGRYFYDHLSVLVGRILPADRTALNRIAGFRFEGRGMRNLRFELAEDPAIRVRVPPSFAHIAFASRPGSGFDALREFYRQLQQRRSPDAPTLARLAKATPWLVRAAWWRFAEHRLLYPSDATIELHMVIEQRPVPENRIPSLLQRIDVFASLLLRSIGEFRLRTRPRLPTQLSSSAISGERARSRGSAKLSVALRWRSRPNSQRAVEYIPGGSARMGRDPTDCVVDSDFRVFRVPNLSLVSTAAFPTGGGTNPTICS